MLNQKLQEEESELVKIRRNYQITIPQIFRKDGNLSLGDYIEIKAKKNCFILRPVKIVYSEDVADDDIRSGRLIGPFKDAKETIKALKTK